MEQANKLNMAFHALLAGVAFGVAHYCRYETTSPIAHAFGIFLGVIAWLLLAWTIMLMILWAITAARS